MSEEEEGNEETGHKVNDGKESGEEGRRRRGGEKRYNGEIGRV